MNEWLQQIAPSARDFFSIGDTPTFWTIINAPITVALVAAFLAWAFKDRVQGFVREIVSDTAEFRELQEEEAARRSVEASTLPEDRGSSTVGSTSLPTAQDAHPVDGAENHFEAAATIIDKLKAYVERAVDRADGRRRRKYKNFPRYDYRPLIETMASDKALAETKASNLLSAFEAWRPYRTSRLAVPKEVLNRLRKLERDICSDGS